MKEFKQQRRNDAKKTARENSRVSREIPLSSLDPQSITARRHQLFDVFSSQALRAVTDDPAGACRLADTALKALSGQEHEPQTSPSALSADASPLSRFAQELERAYA